jgi:hypothetical protein
MPRKRNNNKKKKNQPAFIGPKSYKATMRAQRPKKNAGIQVAVGMPPQKRPQEKSKRLPMIEGVCSVTDPFCLHARNSKWPDGQGGGTLAYQVRGHRQVSTLAHGGLLDFSFSSLPYGWLPNASYAAGVYTLNATYGQTPGSSYFASYADTYRITSWGIVIRNLLPASTASGFVTISKFNDVPTVSSTMVAGDAYGSDVTSYPLCAGFQVTVIGKPLGGTARNFGLQNTNSTELKNGWDVIKVEVIGASASASVIDIEYVYNVEFTLATANIGLHQFTKPDAPHATHTIAASSKVINSMSTIVEGGIEQAGEHFLKLASNAVEDIFSTGLAWLGI